MKQPARTPVVHPTTTKSPVVPAPVPITHPTPPTPPTPPAAPDSPSVTVMKNGKSETIARGTWNMDEKALRAKGYILKDGPNP